MSGDKKCVVNMMMGNAIFAANLCSKQALLNTDNVSKNLPPGVIEYFIRSNNPTYCSLMVNYPGNSKVTPPASTNGFSVTTNGQTNGYYNFPNSAFPNSLVFLNSGNFSIYGSNVSVNVMVIGDGGGGGSGGGQRSGATNSAGGGGGGGGGGIGLGTITTPGNFTVFVGQGGAGAGAGPPGNNPGNTGQNGQGSYVSGNGISIIGEPGQGGGKGGPANNGYAGTSGNGGGVQILGSFTNPSTRNPWGNGGGGGFGAKQDGLNYNKEGGPGGNGNGNFGISGQPISNIFNGYKISLSNGSSINLFSGGGGGGGGLGKYSAGGYNGGPKSTAKSVEQTGFGCTTFGTPQSYICYPIDFGKGGYSSNNSGNSNLIQFDMNGENPVALNSDTLPKPYTFLNLYAGGGGGGGLGSRGPQTSANKGGAGGSGAAGLVVVWW
jgi:hypothetical protein